MISLLDAVLILLIFIIFFALLIRVAEKNLIKPFWYHGNRPPSKGLRTRMIGAPNKQWRLSEKDNGFGNPKESFGLEFEEVTFPNLYVRHKNVLLRGWVIRSTEHCEKRPDEVCIVAIHGAGHDRRSWLRHTPIFVKNGYSVLTFDCEEHGISDGNQRGVGWCTYEPDNLLAAVEYAKHTLKYKKIVVLGTSMGGAASIVAAGLGFQFHNDRSVNHPDPRQYIDCVIAENPFSSRRDVMSEIINNRFYKRIGRLAYLLRPFIVTYVLWRIGDQYHACPIDAVKEIELPLLIMHGTGDYLISPQHSEILYRAAEKAKMKDLWIVEGAQHSGLQNKEPQEWEKRVLAMIRLICK